MNKKEHLNRLKRELYKELKEILEDEQEIETIEKEIYKDKDKEATRTGMIEALMEDFFTRLVHIVEKEDQIEADEKDLGESE